MDNSRIEQYFDNINALVQNEHEIAKEARSKSYDPALKPEIQIAKNMAESVVGLVSVAAPQMVGSGVAARIQELEEKYEVLDWRVALEIAVEVAKQKFCEFEDEREAMEIGIRTGFAYITNGVVSSPLEGFVKLELKERNDRKGHYFSLYYAGPVRNAGGTAAAVSVIVADYVRKKMGYTTYDPTPKEISRVYTETMNYHERITNLQYVPSEQELNYLVRHIPVEVDGDPTERLEVSNFKNLPRIKTNRIRSGMCLVYSSCIPLKAPKLWKQLSNWGERMQLEQWNFLEEFINIQKAAQAKSEKKSEEKITPNFTYIADLVAGRPVFSHPLRAGGFRLRYGRSRLSGLSGQALHPATMILANEFIATGSQLKVERPGKAAAYTVCESIDGPVVRLKNGDVVCVQTEKQARDLSEDVEKILFLGDVLIAYGDFLDRAHRLVPPGYCEEWWHRELEAAGGKCEDSQKVSFNEALDFSQKFGVPLHPKFLYFYSLATPRELLTLWEAIRKVKLVDGMVLSKEVKPLLEKLGIPHTNKCQVSGDDANALRHCFSREAPESANDWQEFMQAVSPVFIKDKAGVFVGARLGRPEKAKMRSLTGSPHTLFPVGSEGGRLRSFNEAVSSSKVTSSFEIFYCDTCKKEVVLRTCPTCDNPAKEIYFCDRCGVSEKESCEHNVHSKSKYVSVNVHEYLQFCLKRLGTSVYPDLIKGVRGTSNKDHATEHLMKGLLRAHHEITVNKDGTVRYDASEVPVTHFRPSEIGLSVDKAVELGYTHDIHKKILTSSDQVLEMFPQDVILPACSESPDEKSDDVLLRTSQFIDGLLVNLYQQTPYYNAESPADLIGRLIVALAPHTSAGTVGRIIGFSETQGLFMHPYMHCACRRDCDGDESCVFLLMDAFLNFSRRYLPSSRGGTMDAPLVISTRLNPSEVDDMVFNMDIAWKYPLEFYKACEAWKMPWEVHIRKVQDVLATPEEFQGLGFTHDTSSINAGNRCSAYKTLPSMQDKLMSQMDLAEKLVAVDEKDVAKLVITKHFLRDLLGNLRKFSQQTFRCVKCNDKYRRPPLRGNCHCGGRIIFTISEGSVVKYLEPAESLVRAYGLDTYLDQTLQLARRRVEEVFGKDPEKQTGLGEWFG